MKRYAILAAFCILTANVGADDKKKLPDLKAKEWKEVKDGDGLKMWEVKEGKGDALKPLGKMRVHYTGWMLDGSIFDSDYEAKDTWELKDMIKGWQTGVPGMKPGGVRRLYIPAKLAYGDKGHPAGIPPKADLVFEIELIEVK